MHILLTTPTGNIGSKLVGPLLDDGHTLTLLARDPSRLSPAVRNAVSVVRGQLEDVEALGTALTGADAAFLLVPPPGPEVTHWRTWQVGIGTQFAEAARAAGVSRVVFLSSVGAQHDDLAAISGLGDVERVLTAALPNVASVRAGYFMENSVSALPTIASHGTVYGVIAPDRQQQIVATSDIAQVALSWLTDAQWSGHHIVGAHGPATLSPNDTAGILSVVLGRPVRYQQIPAVALREALLAAGLPPLMAHGYEEMMGSMARHLEVGDFSSEPQTPESTGSTTFEAFARAVLLPAFTAQLSAAAV